jgi:hypothetical protein
MSGGRGVSTCVDWAVENLQTPWSGGRHPSPAYPEADVRFPQLSEPLWIQACVFPSPDSAPRRGRHA